MPSSIKLSVIFTQQSEDRLKAVYLQEPWQDLMKDMTFSSSKAYMDVNDLALQVEAYIERVYRNRHGDDWGDIQAQVFKVMDEKGTEEVDYQEQVSKRFKPGDTIIMDVVAILAPSSQWTQPMQPQFTKELIEKVRSMLRLGLNDRVICYIGPRWLSGHIVGTAVPDEDGLLPYLVKTDPVPGLPSRTISVPNDKDECCTQEVCFDPVSQLELVRCGASIVNEANLPKLRLALGDKVVCRIRNNPEDGLENWVKGSISEIWPKIGEATWDVGEVSGKFPGVVPYKIEIESGKWVYCHRDDHSLVRREGMQPVTRVKGISKRMETVTEADGTRFCIDHVTGRRKRMLEDDGDSD